MQEPSSTIVEIPVRACEKCPALCESRTRIVNGRGPARARIMIVGEAPGGDEDAKGMPFIGATGKLLARLLDQADIDPTEVYLTNAVRCRPIGNRTPTAAEQANCKPYLLEEIKQVNPSVIITVGAVALQSLLGRSYRLGDVAGQTQEVEGLPPIVPTYHPAYLMRGNWAQSPMVVAHLRKAVRVAYGTSKVQPLEEAREGWTTALSVEEVYTVRDYLLSDDIGMIAVDTETTGLNWMEDELLCISFGALSVKGKPTHMGFTIPIMKRATYTDDEKLIAVEPYWSADEWPAVHQAIDDILRDERPKTVQNAIFDIKFIERSRDDKCVTAETAFGWSLENLAFDPMLAQRLVDENLPANETVMLSLYTDMPFYESDIKAQSQNKRRMDLVDPTVLYEYAAADADGLARITAALMPKLAEQKLDWVYDEITIPMIRVAWNMTRRGINVDLEYFERLSERYGELSRETRAAVIEAAGHEFNPQSVKELRTVLFDELKLPKSGRKTDKGKECKLCREDEECDEHDSIGKDALKDIKDKMENPHPILDATIEFKEVAKRRAMWVDGKDGSGGLVKFIRPDFKIHPTFHPGRADTGRWSATDPAIQTPPKNIRDEKLGVKDQIRRIFVPPKGCKLMELDWSQGEVWVMAYASGDKVLMELLKNGRDVHTFVARKLASFGFSRVFPAEIERPELDEFEWKKEFDDYRKKAKVFVFGLDYGMTEIGAAQRLGCEPEDAKELINAFLGQVFPSLEDHFDRVRAQLDDYGTIRDRFGRVGHFGDGDFMRSMGRRGQIDWEAKFRKGVNMPIQAGLSDLHQLVLADFEFDKVISKRFPMILAIHDSTTGTPKGNRDDLLQTAWIIKERAEDMARHLTLADGTELGWEIPVEVQWGDSWGDFPYVLMADGNFKEPEAV